MVNGAGGFVQQTTSCNRQNANEVATVYIWEVEPSVKTELGHFHLRALFWLGQSH